MIYQKHSGMADISNATWQVQLNMRFPCMFALQHMISILKVSNFLLENFRICTTRTFLGCQADAAARHEIAERCTGLGPAVKLVSMPLPRLFLRTVLWHSQIFTITLSTSREAAMAYKTKMP